MAELLAVAQDNNVPIDTSSGSALQVGQGSRTWGGRGSSLVGLLGLGALQSLVSCWRHLLGLARIYQVGADNRMV